MEKNNAAVEDDRFVVTNDEFALKYRQAIDELQAPIGESASELPDEPENQLSTSYHDDNSDPEQIGSEY